MTREDRILQTAEYILSPSDWPVYPRRIWLCLLPASLPTWLCLWLLFGVILAISALAVGVWIEGPPRFKEWWSKDFNSKTK